MLKKLQNLLFEDEGEEFEEEVEEEVQPVRTKPAVKPAPSPAPKPEVKKPEPAMTRIDVTQPIPSIVKKEEPKPATQHASPKPIAETPLKSEPAKMPSLGITVDEVKKPQEKAKPVRPAAAPAPKKSAPKNPAARSSSIYEFKPVISPMFGVDEKDMNAMQVTANTAKSAALNDSSKSSIISPIYGMNQEARPTNIQTTVEKSNEMENMTYTKEAQKAEDSLPSFSLDDILKARDEEKDDRDSVVESVLKEESDVVDETVVLDAKNLSPFGHVNVPDQKKGK